jgi:hypothetical protein
MNGNNTIPSESYNYYQFESKRLSVSGSTLIIDGGKKKVNATNFMDYVTLLQAVYCEMGIPCTLNIHNDIMEIVSEAYQSCKRQKEEIDFNKPMPIINSNVIDITKNGYIRVLVDSGKVIYNPPGIHTRYYLDDYKTVDGLVKDMRILDGILLTKEEKAKLVEVWNKKSKSWWFYQKVESVRPKRRQYTSSVKFGYFEFAIAEELRQAGSVYKDLASRISLSDDNRYILFDDDLILDTYNYGSKDDGPIVKDIYK